MDTVGSPTLDASFMSPPPIARHSASRHSSFVSSPSSIVAELSRLAGMASIPPDQEIVTQIGNIESVWKEWVARKNSYERDLAARGDAQASKRVAAYREKFAVAKPLLAQLRKEVRGAYADLTMNSLLFCSSHQTNVITY